MPEDQPGFLWDEHGRLLCPSCRKPMQVRQARGGREYAWCCGNSTVCSAEDIALLEAYHTSTSVADARQPT